MQRVGNWMAQDFALKEALGIGRASASALSSLSVARQAPDVRRTVEAIG